MAAKGVIYSTSAGQVISAIDVINWGTTVYDPNSMVTNAASNWTFTAQTTTPHQILAFIMWTGFGKTGYVDLEAYVNGSRRVTLKDGVFAATAYGNSTGAGVISLTAGDTVQIKANNQVTGTLSLYNNASYCQCSIFEIPT